MVLTNCLFFCLLSLIVHLVFSLSPEVILPAGKVEGHFKRTDNGKVYNAFEGIPYARPPVGKYRFAEPKPVKPWRETWKAKTLTKCMQYYHYTQPGQDYVIGDEDCLHINVYTAAQQDPTLKDVIVFIHGGAFMFNSGSSYGEKYLMDYDVVFVTFNYRLGPLGFLSTESKNFPGNNGLKDQLLALQWIKENIRSFGGNPNSITLTGMSAGGASVHLHLLSPKARDVQLFNRAIIQSGTALNPWVLMEKAREKAVYLGSLVGCPGYNMKDMIKCMKYRPAKQIVAAVKNFQPFLYNPFSPFGVVVDKWSDDPVVPVHPYKALKQKDVLNIPVIFSSVESEGLYPAADFVTNNYLREIDEMWNDLVPFILDFNHTVSANEILNVSRKIRRFYFDEKRVDKSTFPTLIKMVSDRLFLCDSERSALMHSAAITEPAYYYFYKYRAANSKSDLRTKSRENYGASHADDTIMVLSTNINTTSTEEDRKMGKILQKMWLSFAKSGSPKLSEANISWEEIPKTLSEGLKYLSINSPVDIRMETAEYLGNRVNFWDTLPLQENQNIRDVRDEL